MVQACVQLAAANTLGAKIETTNGTEAATPIVWISSRRESRLSPTEAFNGSSSSELLVNFRSAYRTTCSSTEAPVSASNVDRNSAIVECPSQCFQINAAVSFNECAWFRSRS